MLYNLKTDGFSCHKPYKIAWWEKILLLTIPPLMAFIVKLLCWSYRIVHVEGKREGEFSGRPSVVYCTWHQRMFYHFHSFGRLHVTMMISASKDGEWAAHIAHWLGFKNVRGSSRKGQIDKGGKRAMEKLIEKVKEGESAGMMADGPRGPAREIKPGAILIAQKTGRAILPQMWGCDRAWVFRSWDRYLIPKPFAKISIIHGDPIYVPSEANEEELEAIRKEVSDKLNKYTERCDEYFGKAWPYSRESKKAEKKDSNSEENYERKERSA